MEQSILSSSVASDYINNDFTTPCRVQKRLFITPSSSSKRSLFQEEKEIKNDEENLSDAESDLGPMSPLTLTDHSSCDSSPGRPLVSPLATPEKLIIPQSDWNDVSSSLKNNYGKVISSYSLKRVIKSAKFSQKSIFEFLPKSKISQSRQNFEMENNIIISHYIDQSIISETPLKEFDFKNQQSYVAETPQKEKYLEHKLITPVGSVCKNIPIPKIGRRKSSDSLKINENISPEIKKCIVKRYSEDSLSISNIEYQKTDELTIVPKARAALFQDEKITNEKGKRFALNPKLFYGYNDKSVKSIRLDWTESQIDLKKRRNFSFYNSIPKRSIKKQKKGEINYGVGHGIKKPKYTLKSLYNVLKIQKQNDSRNGNIKSKENLNPQNKTIKNYQNKKIFSKDIDLTKKLFKNKLNQKATVTVNDKIKVLNQTETKHIDKKARLDKYIFDATDLSVDETSIGQSLEQNKIVNILKILENDWADDEYNIMEASQTVKLRMNTLSPKKSKILKDMTTSPASELSNMASTMNIEDISVYSKDYVNNTIQNVGIPIQKFYPLFSKTYSANIINNKIDSKKRKRMADWQLSTKYNNNNNQYQIDAGQKIFGATQCNECELIYNSGDPDDENAHLKYHNSFKSLKFLGWKNERIIYEDPSNLSRIILIEPKDSNLYWKKVNEVLKIVDQDLGLSDTKPSFYRDKRVYMYIRNKTILGILVAEYIKTAFQMIPELIELNCCTSETTSVKCGINVVWIAMSHRRQGIATKLVDVLRANYYYGYIMSITDVAFSTPTLSGKQFAEKYTKTRNFKVY